jgi:hypothetical protein
MLSVWSVSYRKKVRDEFFPELIHTHVLVLLLPVQEMNLSSLLWLLEQDCKPDDHVRLPSVEKHYSFLHSSHTRLDSHPVFYAMGAEGSDAGDKAAEK